MNTRLFDRIYGSSRAAVLAGLLALAAGSAAAQPSPSPAGRWDWFNNGVVTLGFDGIALAAHGEVGTWNLLDAAQRTLVVRWRAGWVDTLTLSADGAMLEGTNQQGARVWGKRKDAQPVWQLAGLYDAQHPAWQGALTLIADGVLRRGENDAGRWIFDGRKLTLLWTNGGPEQLELRRAGRFVRREPRFVLVKRPVGIPAPVAAVAPEPAPAAPPAVVVVERSTVSTETIIGTWDCVHPHWRGPIRFRRNGQFARANGDGGTWRLDGNGITIAWTRWGSEHLELRPSGRLRSANRKFTLTKRD